MANQSIALSADLYDYLLDQGLREPGILQQLRAFNQQIRSDSRIELNMLPVADGITLAMKR